MAPTHFYGAGAEKPLQKADFSMKQTNICRLSGDIIRSSLSQDAPMTKVWRKFINAAGDISPSGETYVHQLFKKDYGIT